MPLHVFHLRRIAYRVVNFISATFSPVFFPRHVYSRKVIFYSALSLLHVKNESLYTNISKPCCCCRTGWQFAGAVAYWCRYIAMQLCTEQSVDIVIASRRNNALRAETMVGRASSQLRMTQSHIEDFMVTSTYVCGCVLLAVQIFDLRSVATKQQQTCHSCKRNR